MSCTTFVPTTLIDEMTMRLSQFLFLGVLGLSAGGLGCSKAITIEKVAFDAKDLPSGHNFSVGVSNQTGREMGVAIIIDGHTVFSAVLLGDQHFGAGGVSID